MMMWNDGASSNNGETSVINETAGDEAPPDVGPDEPAAQAIRIALIVADRRLRQHDPAARLGEVEGVHRMRTSARRLRSHLHLFRPLLEGDWADPLSAELQWLGKRLGAVRDSDVMRERLRQAAGELLDDLGPLFATLTDRHTHASAALRDALESRRYRDLLGRLSEAAGNALFRDEAWERCRTAFPPLVLDVWQTLKKTGRALDLGASDEEYHEVRKRAKRARYAAESIAHALDPDVANDARRFACRAHAVQDVLGEHQDAVIACEEIRHAAADSPAAGPFHLAAGRLLERQEIAAREARARFFKVWRKLDRKKNRRWMKV
jgi:CHAD domain-containing protein